MVKATPATIEGDEKQSYAVPMEKGLGVSEKRSYNFKYCYIFLLAAMRFSGMRFRVLKFLIIELRCSAGSAL
ncbi:MAG: hypothetical protein ACKPBV_17645 [Sphaerospermopsis kisseleviana]